MTAYDRLLAEGAALRDLVKGYQYSAKPPKDPTGWEPPTAKRKTWRKHDGKGGRGAKGTQAVSTRQKEREFEADPADAARTLHHRTREAEHERRYRDLTAVDGPEDYENYDDNDPLPEHAEALAHRRAADAHYEARLAVGRPHYARAQAAADAASEEADPVAHYLRQPRTAAPTSKPAEPKPVATRGRSSSRRQPPPPPSDVESYVADLRTEWGDTPIPGVGRIDERTFESIARNLQMYNVDDDGHQVYSKKEAEGLAFNLMMQGLDWRTRVGRDHGARMPRNEAVGPTITLPAEGESRTVVVSEDPRSVGTRAWAKQYRATVTGRGGDHYDVVFHDAGKDKTHGGVRWPMLIREYEHDGLRSQQWLIDGVSLGRSHSYVRPDGVPIRCESNGDWRIDESLANVKSRPLWRKYVEHALNDQAERDADREMDSIEADEKLAESRFRGVQAEARARRVTRAENARRGPH